MVKILYRSKRIGENLKNPVSRIRFLITLFFFKTQLVGNRSADYFCESDSQIGPMITVFATNFFHFWFSGPKKKFAQKIRIGKRRTTVVRAKSLKSEWVFDYETSKKLIRFFFALLSMTNQVHSSVLLAREWKPERERLSLRPTRDINRRDKRLCVKPTERREAVDQRNHSKNNTGSVETVVWLGFCDKEQRAFAREICVADSFTFWSVD